MSGKRAYVLKNIYAFFMKKTREAEWSGFVSEKYFKKNMLTLAALQTLSGAFLK